MSTIFNIASLPSDKITIFDLKFNDKAPENSVSPWTRVAINALLVKKLAFHVELVEIVDIPSVCKILGVKPAREEPIFYTLPAIYDPKTKTALADSLVITQYLDKQYPETPVLVPVGTEGLIAAFKAAYAPIDKKSAPFIVPRMLTLVAGTKSEVHFRETRTKAFGGRNLDTLAPTGAEAEQEWADIKRIYDEVDAWYGEKMFIMGGDHPTYSDVFVAGRMWWYRSTLGPESDEWKRLSSWNEGRWGKLIAHFDNISK